MWYPSFSDEQSADEENKGKILCYEDVMCQFHSNNMSKVKQFPILDKINYW